MEGNLWPRIAVLGAGAVGCYFGGMLARAGATVTLIGRPPHVGAITRDGLFFDGLHFQQQIPVSASAEVSATRDAEIVLFCVKTLDTEEAARLRDALSAVADALGSEAVFTGCPGADAEHHADADPEGGDQI